MDQALIPISTILKFPALEKEDNALFNLEIEKKSGLSINSDIHYSKVLSSDEITETSDRMNRNFQTQLGSQF